MLRSRTSKLAKLAKYTTGIVPVLHVKNTQEVKVSIKESEWVSVLNDVFGAPLENYVQSRYPETSKSDVEKIREELRNSFHFKADWEAQYKKYNMPDEMFRARARLEAELDPTNEAKLKRIDHDEAQTADPFASLRIKLLQEEQKIAEEYKSLNGARGALSSPNIDWRTEYSTTSPALAAEKRQRYEKLASTFASWPEDLAFKWSAAYRHCSDEAQKDIDIDYLRYLEGHIRDQFRAEKWYQRLAEDGESTLTYEEVEAWLPEYYDTQMVDYDGWWELVSRGTDASQWDRYQQTNEAYHQGIQQKFNSTKNLLQGAEDSINKLFAPSSVFETFRNVPAINGKFKEALKSS